MVLVTSSVQAVGVESLLNELNGITKTEDVQPAETEQQIPESSNAAAQSNIMTNYYGESKDVHDYEGALTLDDKICKCIVDPFTLTDNVSALLKDVVSDAGNMLLERVKSGKINAPSADELLQFVKAKARKLNWMPMQQEIRYGKRIHEQRLETKRNLIERSKKGRVKRLYAKADEILDRVLLEIKEEHPYQFKLFLIDDLEINAEALPGGYLYVNTGVLESDYAELVFAHEIAHVLKRHQTREIQAKLIGTVETLQDLKTLLDNRKPNAMQIVKRAVLLHGLFINYSQQQELQADACSVRITHRIPGMDLDSKIDPYVASLSSDIQSENKLRGKGHPDYPERSKRMKEVVWAVKNEEGKGSETKIVINTISKSDTIKSVDQSQTSTDNNTQQPTEVNLEDRLNILKKLKDKGLITKDEYKARKKEILDKL